MAIYDQLAGVQGSAGAVILMCKTCLRVAQDAKSLSAILKVCPKCGLPLGEWANLAERDTELKVFADRVIRDQDQSHGPRSETVPQRDDTVIFPDNSLQVNYPAEGVVHLKGGQVVQIEDLRRAPDGRPKTWVFIGHYK